MTANQAQQIITLLTSIQHGMIAVVVLLAVLTGLRLLERVLKGRQ